MRSVSLAEAKAKLSELVAEAEAGGTVQIMRRGKLVAQITPVKAVRKPVVLADLKAVTDRMAGPPVDTDAAIRNWREDNRY